MKIFLYVALFIRFNRILIIHHYFHSQSVTYVFYIYNGCALVSIFYSIDEKSSIKLFNSSIDLTSSTYFSMDINTLIPLYAFFVIESCFHLKGRAFSIFVLSLGVVCLTITISSYMEWHYFILFVLLLICAHFLHNYLSEVNEKRDLYEQLLLNIDS